MKNLFASLVLFVLVALASGQESATPPKDMSGFSGYGWGTSIEFIAESMASHKFVLLSEGPKDLWYRGNVADEKLQFVYHFKNRVLTGGMWVIEDVDYESYWKVNKFLTNTYNSNAKLKIRGDEWIETEFAPADTHAFIVHRLDVERQTHVVHYYYRRGED